MLHFVPTDSRQPQRLTLGAETGNQPNSENEEARVTMRAKCGIKVTTLTRSAQASHVNVLPKHSPQWAKTEIRRLPVKYLSFCRKLRAVRSFRASHFRPISVPVSSMAKCGHMFRKAGWVLKESTEGRRSASSLPWLTSSRAIWRRWRAAMLTERL